MKIFNWWVISFMLDVLIIGLAYFYYNRHIFFFTLLHHYDFSYFLPTPLSFSSSICASLPVSPSSQAGLLPRLKAKCYLNIFLSSEYFTSSLKDLVHTERGPASRSRFNWSFYTRRTETSVFQTWWQSVCMFKGGLWSEDVDATRHEPKLWSAGVEPQMMSLNWNTICVDCCLCGPIERLLLKKSLLSSIFLPLPVSRCPEWEWFRLSYFSKPPSTQLNGLHLGSAGPTCLHLTDLLYILGLPFLNAQW